jgi:hypothetical protein
MVFIVEMGLKLLVLSPAGYVKDPFNNVDGFIVIVSVLDLILTSFVSLKAFRSLKIFRTLKILRLNRVLRSLQQFVLISHTIQACFQQLINICSALNIVCLVLIFLFIFALLGI